MSPDPVADLLAHDAVADLLARFDDAVLRNDRAAFADLWTADAVWEIGPPVPMRAAGVQAIPDALDGFHATNDFFFRLTGRPVVRLDGDRGTARSPTVELARRGGRTGYANVALYHDDLRREGGGWRFARRRYQYLWVDLETPLGGRVAPPPTGAGGASPPGHGSTVNPESEDSAP